MNGCKDCFNCKILPSSQQTKAGRRVLYQRKVKCSKGVWFNGKATATRLRCWLSVMENGPVLKEIFKNCPDKDIE